MCIDRNQNFDCINFISKNMHQLNQFAGSEKFWREEKLYIRVWSWHEVDSATSLNLWSCLPNQWWTIPLIFYLRNVLKTRKPLRSSACWWGMGLWGKLALWSATPRTGTPRNTPPLPLTTSQVRREREARGDVRRERLINCNDMLSGIFLNPT